jgi:sterol desaturase/sphingolipid hydroxylase (fatty acid hydroxylase superfamily)
MAIATSQQVRGADDMRGMVRRSLVLAALVLGCLPVSFVMTILLLPVWGKIESRYGIESVGHSGPADWCFWLVYAVSVAAGFVAFRLWDCSPRDPRPRYPRPK